jgi:hypothetical protein
MQITEQLLELEKSKLNLETSSIAWRELQRFFAAGVAISVHPSLDLIDVASEFAMDNKLQVEEWITLSLLGPVEDEQALLWYEQNLDVWAVVVKPWILVQQRET